MLRGGALRAIESRGFDSLRFARLSLLAVILAAAAPFCISPLCDSPQAAAAEDASDEGVMYFERHVRPLLIEHCYKCHSARDDKRQGGLVLDSRAGWLKGGEQGPSVVPGNPDASLLIRAVRFTDPDMQMPPEKPLPKDAIERLEKWVRIGAPAPSDDAAAKPNSPSAGGKKLENPSDPVAGREHWSFRPLAPSTPPPRTTDSRWARSPIDSFVLEKLESLRIQPTADTNRATLLRRVHLQLVGLPPTTDELAEFVADDRPDALELVVDRLLASPRFGERWGRHWLDHARYADSNGLDENFLFREAWRYRNWVIAAVNADLPFDRFLTEQIAGDLLPFESIEQRDRQRIAAGFLVVGPKVLLGNDPNQRRMDVADELLDTVGRTVLGQTLGCARCHDHKFDPVPTADYYALAGIFTSTQVMQTRYMLNEQRDMERLVGLGPDGDSLNSAYEKYWRELPKLKDREAKAKSALDLLEKGDEKGFIELAAKHADAVAEGALVKMPAAETPAPEKAAPEKAAPTEKAAATEKAAVDQAPAEKAAAEKAEVEKAAESAAAEKAAAEKAAAEKLAELKPQRVAAQKELLERLRGELKNAPKIPPRAMIPADVEKPADEAIRVAGQFNRLGNKVPRGFLRVVGDSTIKVSDGHSGRLELATWLTDVDQGAGRLAARVLANRLWQRMIGRGLVRTVDNFGRTGETPSHPQLLEHLAGRIVERESVGSRWSVKRSVREIALSRVFALDSRASEDSLAADPDNQWLSRGHRRRAEPEALRDAMLLAADGLSLTPIDSTVAYLGDQATAVGDNKVRRRTDFPNRSVYLPVIRNDLPELFDVFDFANPHASTGQRPQTMVAPQGLFLLNDPSVMSAADLAAKRLLVERTTADDGVLIERLFERLAGMKPTADERSDLLNFIHETKGRLTNEGAKDAELRAWALAVQAIFASSRFQIVD